MVFPFILSLESYDSTFGLNSILVSYDCEPPENISMDSEGI